VRYRTIITEIIFVRMYITVFELIRKNASRERQIDDISDNGKYDMRALFQER